MGRRVKRIEYSKNFLKSLRKLPERIISQAEEKEKIFKDNSFHSVLRTHKLSGKDKDCWVFWINYSYRIIICATPSVQHLHKPYLKPYYHFLCYRIFLILHPIPIVHICADRLICGQCEWQTNNFYLLDIQCWTLLIEFDCFLRCCII